MTGYHVFNLAVHLFTAILVWWLVLLTLSTPAMKENKITQHADLVALLSGLVFVSHPLQTEAVTYIVQRTASMATLFYLASLCLYVKSRLLQDTGVIERSDFQKSVIARSDFQKSVIARSEATKQSFNKDFLSMQKIYYIFSLIAAILAMFTKETAITLPLMILLYEFSFFPLKAVRPEG